MLNCQKGDIASVSDSVIRKLTTPDQAHLVWTALWSKLVKPRVTDGAELEVIVRPAKRTLDQNAKFHAICKDIAKSGMTFAGKERDAAQWKILLVSGHAMATKEGAEIVPGIEGEYVNLRESTARMTKARSSSLIEYALAFCAANSVEIHEIQD